MCVFIIKYNFRTKYIEKECYNKMSAVNGHKVKNSV